MYGNKSSTILAWAVTFNTIDIKAFSFYEKRGGGLSSYKLVGLCRWIGSHFRVWIEKNVPVFSIELT